MADNVAITAGSGTSILTDDCTTGHAQIMKLAIATDGSATLIPADASGLLVNLGANNDVTVTGSVTALGDVAHDTGDSGNPQKIGAKAIAGLNGATLVAAADRTDLFAGIDGALIVRPYCCLEDIVTGTASNTDGASFSVIAAGAAGIKHYITSITIVNTSTTAIFCEIKDNATTKIVIPVPAQGGATVNLPVPIPGTAATAWNCDPSAATTTVYCTMVGFKSKV